jgi:hypothetical protein
MKLKTRKPTGAVPWPLVLVEGEEKAGKAQPLHARIATPAGWTTMGELTAGSRVIGSDGRPVTVTAVYERGERDIYRVIFSDGAQVEACDEHLWATTTSSNLHRTYKKGPKQGQPQYRPPVIRTTAELREKVLNGTVVHIPMTAPVEYDADETLPLDPYALGLLLGDGGLSKQNYPTFTTGDPELFDALASALPPGDALTRLLSEQITAGIKGGGTTAALRELGLIGRKSADKFIPACYMTASTGDRLALLQGLMDTDGGMEWKSITFTSVSYRMACEVQELARSLGGSCSMRSKQPSYRAADGSRVECQTAYTLRMRLPLGVCPFRLERKVERWAGLRPAFSTPPRRTVKAVEYAGRMPARCIAVDAADHLYLTDHFVVTHNTWSCAQLTASDKTGRCFWIDLGEGAADEYGAIPGADYEIVEHDGSFAALLANVTEIHGIAAKALADGEKPVVLVIDTMTDEWDMLKDWATDRARSSRANRKKLEQDPNAEIIVSGNYWNDANTRHRKLMRLLKTFPGICLMTSHGKAVAVIGPDGQPVEGKKEHKVEAQKSLGADASCWLRLYRNQPGVIVGGRSVRLQFRPGDAPKPLAKNWTLESIIFDVLGCDPATAHVRDLAERTPDTVTPEQIRDEALRPRTTADRVGELWKEAKRLGYDDVTVINENQAEELLMKFLARTGTEKRAAEWVAAWRERLAAAATDAEVAALRDEASKALTAGTIQPATSSKLFAEGRQRHAELSKLADDDPWLVKIRDVASVADAGPVEDELIAALGDDLASTGRLETLRAALASRTEQLIEAESPVAA